MTEVRRLLVLPDHHTGSLERGKLADLIVLDRNLFRVPVDRISETKVLMTMLGGKVAHGDLDLGR
jgi:predicted amidohydrolase YtcJ